MNIAKRKRGSPFEEELTVINCRKLIERHIHSHGRPARWQLNRPVVHRHRKMWVLESEMINFLKRLEAEVSAWPKVSIRPHRFGGREFRFGKAEVGHVHTGGIVDIPFPRSIRDALVAENLAEQHHWVPNSGWITFHIRNEHDVSHALRLMRLSYLRYTLKTASDPQTIFAQESEQLYLSSQFRSLFEPFVPKTANPVSAEPLSA